MIKRSDLKIILYECINVSGSGPPYLEFKIQKRINSRNNYMDWHDFYALNLIEIES